jgi:hypothetical protein
LFVRDPADRSGQKIPKINPGEKGRRKQRLSLTCAMKKQSEVPSRKAALPRRNHKPPTRKRLGELAELAFMSKAASLGFGVAKPYGDSERFDFILSRDGRLWRVQVKSTRTAKRGVYEISAHGCWGAHDIYTKDEIDLIVAYVVPLDVCYIIPIEATRGRKRLCLHPDVPRKACYKYEKYREAWWPLQP